MKRQAYESTPLPISWERSEYTQGKMDVAYIFPLTDQPVEVGTALKYARSEDAKFKQVPGYAGSMNVIPSKTLYINVDTAALVKDGILPAGSAHPANTQMMLDFSNKPFLAKHEMMILEMLNNAQWKRPVYYAVTVGSDQQLSLQDKHFRLEGLTYRIVPFDVNATGQQVQTDIMFDNMVHKFRWGGIENPKVYLDDNVLRMVRTHRFMFARLADALIREGKKEKAIEALDTCQRVIPPATIRYTYDGLNIAACYYDAGAKDKAIDIYEQLMDYYMTALHWYFRLNNVQFRSVYSTVRENLGYVQHILSRYQQIQPELIDKYREDFSRYTKVMMSDIQSNKPAGQ
jgi:tetratricopeptide (TPR) repeat protein